MSEELTKLSVKQSKPSDDQSKPSEVRNYPFFRFSEGIFGFKERILSFARDKLKKKKSYYLIFSPLIPANIGNDTTNKNRRLTCQRIDLLNVIFYIIAECKRMNGKQNHLIFGWIGMKKTMMKNRN